MALSNIFREPRREITETAIGTVVASLPVSAILGLAAIWQHYDPTDHSYWLYVLFTVAFLVVFAALVAIAGVVLVIAAVGVHAAGEGICNVLEDLGVRLRPRRS